MNHYRVVLVGDNGNFIPVSRKYELFEDAQSHYDYLVTGVMAALLDGVKFMVTEYAMINGYDMAVRDYEGEAIYNHAKSVS
jgi:hypothetical protein